MTKLLNFASAIGITLAITACTNPDPNRSAFFPSMYEGSAVVNRPMVVEESYFVKKVMHDEIDEHFIDELMHDYNHRGASPIYVVMSYDPSSASDKSSAKRSMGLLRGKMAKMGVRNAQFKLLPIVDGGDDIILGYDRLTARGPSNCGVMPGYDVRPVGDFGNYAFGCKHKDLIAQQVAYPGDLLGKTKMDDFQAARANQIIVRDPLSGELQDFVPGYILSQVGG